ncbi:SERPIN domain-containing protein [Heracleum sosnowskyi]|uniref:SERPIN domain-containing protein n=1 Tax=Heracleum sosnowskyi TaxID=360622 RepID=A0AAD8IFH3_9APIA|nr:SERPIN domain-containing protein [Heracleum sosnowskyi]
MESSEQKKISDFNSHFCIKLSVHNLLREVENGSNFVFSPVSLQIFLSLISIGSTGRTLDQLLTCLGSRSIEDLNSLSSRVVDLTAGQHSDDKDLTTGPLVTMVHSVLIDQCFGLNSSYEGLLKDVYNIEVKVVDFASKASQVTEEVNIWAEDATKGLLKELLPPVSLGTDTALVFANALHFKGAWDKKLDLERSMHRDFYLLTSEIVQVPYMTTKKRERSLYREING